MLLVKSSLYDEVAVDVLIDEESYLMGKDSRRFGIQIQAPR